MVERVKKPSLWEDFWRTVQSDLFGIGPPYQPTYFEHPDYVNQLKFDFINPRISRKRFRTATGPTPGVLTHIARNGITHEITSVTPVQFEDERPSLSSIEDTIINKDYYTVFVDPPVDNGGKLTLMKSTFLSSPAGYSTDWHANVRHEGVIPVIAPPSDADGFLIWDWNSLPSVDENEIVGLGTKAWNISRPAQSRSNLANSVAEARDLPSLLHYRLSGIRSIGDFVLLEQFGWENLLRDIRNMWNIYSDIANKIEFLIRNDGKPVRRRFVFEDEYTSEVLDAQTGVNGLMYNSGPGNGLPSNWETAGYHRLLKKEVKRASFSGTFIFYLNGDGVPFNDTPAERLRLAALLSGEKITPGVVWDSLPWSWLIDYFVNIGDILSNMSAEVADRQLTTHAYIMQERVTQYQREGSDGYLHASLRRTITTKVRRKVDPYGLAGNIDLSPKQVLILAALGISRT